MDEETKARFIQYLMDNLEDNPDGDWDRGWNAATRYAIHCVQRFFGENNKTDDIKILEKITKGDKN